MIEGKKISKLDPIQHLQDGCCFPVLSRGATRRITFTSLLNNIIAKLPEANREEIDEIKRTISSLEKQLAKVAIDHAEIDELLKDVTFTINGQNETILEYTAKIREFEQEINSSSIAESIRRINSFIPSTASENNKLADKSYVDESIQTSTAVNRGNFDTYADLIAYSGTVTRNDYATVGDDETHDHEAWRYKWNDDINEWTPEYRINESPMTQAQLAALNSGITEELVEQFSQASLPINKVEAGNMNSVTSNAVAEEIEKFFFSGKKWNQVNKNYPLPVNSSSTVSHTVSVDCCVMVAWQNTKAGNTLHIKLNGNIVWQYANYGNVAGSGVAEIFARKGDSLVVTCDGGDFLVNGIGEIR